jgi:hypothetical protein
LNSASIFLTNLWNEGFSDEEDRVLSLYFIFYQGEGSGSESVKILNTFSSGGLFSGGIAGKLISGSFT